MGFPTDLLDQTEGSVIAMRNVVSSQRVPGVIVAGLGGVFLLMSLVWLGAAIHVMRLQQTYVPGHCTIISKRLLQGIARNTRTHRTYPVYAPSFEFVVHTTTGSSYRASGYDGSNTYTSDLSSQQRILDAYALGSTYGCWYDPANPSDVVLARSPSWLLFIGPAVLLLSGIAFLPVGILILQGRLRMTEVSSRRRASPLGETLTDADVVT